MSKLKWKLLTKKRGSGTKCGYACPTIVKGKDCVFTAYPKR